MDSRPGYLWIGIPLLVLSCLSVETTWSVSGLEPRKVPARLVYQKPAGDLVARVKMRYPAGTDPDLIRRRLCQRAAELGGDFVFIADIEKTGSGWTYTSDGMSENTIPTEMLIVAGEVYRADDSSSGRTTPSPVSR